MFESGLSLNRTRFEAPWNPQVLAVVADRLAQPPSAWRHCAGGSKSGA